MNPTIALIRSAFGPTATLYDALQSSKIASQAELKRSYRKLALKYHPDKQAQSSSNSNDELIKEATSKFQAVSAAYEVLMDENRRSLYDISGRIVNDDELNYGKTQSDFPSSHRSNYRSNDRRDKHQKTTKASDEQQRWDDFFNSVFREITGAESRYGDAVSYRNSSQEKKDVLKFYATCKGDLQMVLKCVVHGREKDFDRWRNEIIMPAIVTGDAVDYFGITNAKHKVSTGNTRITDLVDSGEDSDDCGFESRKKKNYKRSIVKKKRLKRNRSDSGNHSETIQSAVNFVQDFSNDAGDRSSKRSGTVAPPSMNRKEKLEFRVAKMRKMKATRELEIANILKSKTWNSGFATESKTGQRGQYKRTGAFSDAFLSNFEDKYFKGSMGSTKNREKVQQKK